MKTKLLLLTVICGVYSMIPAAFAQIVTDSGTLKTTAVSGNTGKTHANTTGASNFAMVGFSFTEKGGDRPCITKVFYDDLNDESMLLGKSHQFKKHNCGSQNADIKSAIFSNDRYFVHKIKVCTNSAGDRIKGVEIWPVYIKANGTKSFPSDTVKKTRTNCTKWHTRVACGNSKVAVGVQVHYTDDDGYKAIALKCMKHYKR